ncbi:MAG: esterase [Planctomycetaceae bacterium]|nr:esterase [Planctomycetaceae bacterium]|tara:strand:- start:193 stop:927 length:735 start_codon:yes stop_codon:yes gene_type:complete
MSERNWTRQDIAGHMCDLYLPAHASNHGYSIIYLHDFALQGSMGCIHLTESFEQYGFCVIAPDVKRSWWSDKICLEFDENQSAENYLLESVMPWLAEHWQVVPPRIGLLGTGMGGQASLRFGFKYPDLFPVVAAITPKIDHQSSWWEPESFLDQMYLSEEAVRQDTATLHIHPLYWPRNIWFCSHSSWLDSAQRLQMKLSALGIPYEAELDHTDQTPTEYEKRMADPAVRFLTERLETERKRIG